MLPLTTSTSIIKSAQTSILTTTPSSSKQHFDDYTCTLCGKLLKSKATLRNHENKFHKFNRLVPHFPILSSPNDIEILKQCIIINIQNRLGFNRHNVGAFSRKYLRKYFFSTKQFFLFTCEKVLYCEFMISGMVYQNPWVYT